jgi:hypothetical protein
MSNEASHGETKNAHGNTKSAHQEEEEKIVDERTQVLQQLWHLVWVTLLSEDKIQMRKSMNEEGFESMFSHAWDLTQKLCGCLK